jgi:hypothetical protein
MSSVQIRSLAPIFQILTLPQADRPAPSSAIESDLEIIAGQLAGLPRDRELPNWDRAEGWVRRFKRKVGMIPAVSDTKSDGEAIAAAVEEAVSSTGEQHRGTGLAQMRNFVSQCRDGRFRIMSRCGEVIFRPGQQPDVKTYDVPIGGTLIEWSVLL